MCHHRPTPNRGVQRTGVAPAADAESFGGVMRRLLSVAGLIVAALVGTGCDGSIYARGIVLTPEAVPIAGATIVLASPKGWTFRAKSNAAGCFNVGGITAPGRYRYSLVAVAPARKPATAAIRTRRQNAITITLAEEGGRGESAAVVVKKVPCSAD